MIENRRIGRVVSVIVGVVVICGADLMSGSYADCTSVDFKAEIVVGLPERFEYFFERIIAVSSPYYFIPSNGTVDYNIHPEMGADHAESVVQRHIIQFEGSVPARYCGRVEIPYKADIGIILVYKLLTRIERIAVIAGGYIYHTAEERNFYRSSFTVRLDIELCPADSYLYSTGRYGKGAAIPVSYREICFTRKLHPSLSRIVLSIKSHLGAGSQYHLGPAGQIDHTARRAGAVTDTYALRIDSDSVSTPV